MRDLLRSLVPKPIWKTTQFIFYSHYRKDVLRKLRYKEKHRCYGWKESEKVFYIIRRESPVEGIFSQVNYVMTHCEYAERNGWIPIVDMQESLYPLWDGSYKKTGENIWEIFYKQPSGYNLNDIKKCRNIILGHGVRWEYPQNIEFLLNLDIYNLDSLNKWNQIYNKYIRPNREVQAFIDKIELEIFRNGYNVLGVFSRLIILHEKGRGGVKIYPDQMGPAEMLKMINLKMEEWNCEYCFVSTEYQDAIDFLKMNLGEKLLLVNRPRLEPTVEETELVDEKTDIYNLNLAYIAEINILSKCRACVYSLSNGSINAMIQNDGNYEHVWIYKE